MASKEQKTIAILGSTGSIGVSTLEIVAAFPERYRVVSLTAGSNTSLLKQQISQFRPEVVAVADESVVQRLHDEIGADGPEILAGVDGLTCCATHPAADMVVSAIVGAAGLVPTMGA